MSSKMTRSATVHKSNSGSGLVLALGCGCTDPHSVSVLNTFRANHTPTPRPRPLAPCSPDALSSSSSSSFRHGPRANAAGSPSFSELLRQLDVSRAGRQKERSTRAPSSGRFASRRVEESVVVVKETVDPLGDFRRSMLHMIVEEEIAEGAELRALLRRFLVLNSPLHHALILRAFAEVWDEVFAGGRRRDVTLRPLPPYRSAPVLRSVHRAGFSEEDNAEKRRQFSS